MEVEGYPVVMEGMCGGAYVRVPDARSGFARWAIRTGKGTKDHKSGTLLSADADSQSADRAAAYARAFATVLRQNGVSCDVEEYID